MPACILNFSPAQLDVLVVVGDLLEDLPIELVHIFLEPVLLVLGHHVKHELLGLIVSLDVKRKDFENDHQSQGVEVRQVVGFLAFN